MSVNLDIYAIQTFPLPPGFGLNMASCFGGRSFPCGSPLCACSLCHIPASGVTAHVLSLGHQASVTMMSEYKFHNRPAIWCYVRYQCNFGVKMFVITHEQVALYLQRLIVAYSHSTSLIFCHDIVRWHMYRGSTHWGRSPLSASGRMWHHGAGCADRNMSCNLQINV